MLNALGVSFKAMDRSQRSSAAGLSGLALTVSLRWSVLSGSLLGLMMPYHAARGGWQSMNLHCLSSQLNNFSCLRNAANSARAIEAR